MSNGLGKVFYQGADDEFHELGECGDITTELTSEDSGDALFSSDPIEFECKLECDKNISRLVKSGFNRGYYNGLTLKEEGHLDSKNGWLHDS